MSLSSAVVAFAVALTLLYLVPWAVRRRAVLVESTADDRFSPHMRVLSVSAPDSTGRRVLHGPVLDPVSAQRRTEALQMKRPTAPVAARMTARDLSAARAKRAAEIAERSAAIKRRQVLAGSLASAALILALLAGFGVLSWAWMLIPTAALVAVLEAGRRVAASYREADLKARKTMAALERRMRALNARDARPAPRAGGQSASAAPELESTAQGESATGQAADNPSGATEARAEESTSAPARDSAPVIVASDVPEAVVGEVRWDPVAVPAPSYTLKAPAPRRTIEPHADTLPSEEKAAAVPARPTTARMLNATDDQADDASVIDVDSALARRRVAGE